MFCSVTITILIHCSFILPIMFIIEVTSVAWNLGLFSRFTENIGQRIYENTPNESCKDTLICYVKFKRITAFFGKLNWAVRTVQFTTDNTVFIYTWEFIPEIYCPQLVLINKPKQKKNKPGFEEAEVNLDNPCTPEIVWSGTLSPLWPVFGLKTVWINLKMVPSFIRSLD